MGITFKSFLSCVNAVTKVRKPILLRARHGVGKSEVVYQLAAAMGLPVVERRASQMTEGDLLGLPKISKNETVGCPPDWFMKACHEPVVLFVDEIDRATMEVRQGFFQLTDSRRISGVDLHPGTLIFAAVNGGDHAAQYQVGEMDPAELDRWTVFDLEPSVEDWLTWATSPTSGVHKLIVDFIRSNPNHLEHQGDFEPNKVYPSRRSWTRLSECLSSADLLQPGVINADLYNLTTAFCGMEAGFAFQDFIKNCQKLLGADDILVKGDIEATKDLTLNEHCALVEKIVASKRLAKKASKAQLENLAKYFFTLPSEAAMKLWTDLSNCHMDNVIALTSLTVNGQRVADHLLSLIPKEEESKK